MREVEDVRHSPPLFNLRAVLAGALASLVLSAALAAVTALSVYLTPLSEGYLSLALYYGGFLVILAGGIVSGRAASRLGWLHGGMAGFAAAAVALLLLGVFFPGGLLTGEVVRQAGLAFLAGAIGGMIGVNL